MAKHVIWWRANLNVICAFFSRHGHKLYFYGVVIPWTEWGFGLLRREKPKRGGDG